MIGDKTKIYWFLGGYLSATLLSFFVSSDMTTPKMDAENKHPAAIQEKEPTENIPRQNDENNSGNTGDKEINSLIQELVQFNLYGGKNMTYQDDEGNQYRVMSDNFQFYRAFCFTPTTADKATWEPVESLPWRTSYREAQQDLDDFARREALKLRNKEQS